jgi:hypothetical protein
MRPARNTNSCEVPGRPYPSHLDRIGPTGPSLTCQTSRPSLPAKAPDDLFNVDCSPDAPHLSLDRPRPSVATVLTSSRAALIAANTGRLLGKLPRPCLVCFLPGSLPCPVPMSNAPVPMSQQAQAPVPTAKKTLPHTGRAPYPRKVPTSWSPQLTRAASRSASHRRFPRLSHAEPSPAPRRRFCATTCTRPWPGTHPFSALPPAAPNLAIRPSISTLVEPSQHSQGPSYPPPASFGPPPSYSPSVATTHSGLALSSGYHWG